MRRIIAAFRISLDGFTTGPEGEMDWVASWGDAFDLISRVDTCILGGGMYPGYEQYWTAILANPEGLLSFTGKVPAKDEITWSRFAEKTPHIVLSKELEAVSWKTTRIVRDIEEIRKLKQQSGKDIYAIGGATFVCSLLNHNLIDEIRLKVHPVILGGGKPLFKDVTDRRVLTLVEAKPLPSGQVSLTYSTQS
jgi:dihydrofolate reductase